MAEQKLTTKQEAFAIEYITNGRNATEAYRKVYDSKTESDASLWVQAHRVLKNSKVAIRIHQIEMEEYSEQILSIEERKQLLTRWAKDGSDKAIDLLNKMESVYTEKIEHSGEITTKRVINLHPTTK